MNYFNQKLLDLQDYLLGPELWSTLGKAVWKTIVILVIATLIIRVGSKIINKVFTSKQRGPFRISKRREVTLRKLMLNMLKYTVYFITFIMILDDVLHFKIGPLLAGAGVAGLAIGFGAQSLVKDIISGFFIIFEDQFSVGDYIATSGAEGTVEEIGIRTTKIMSWTGEQHVVPNGNISQVTNYSIHNGLAVVDVNVPYENDIEMAERIIIAVISELPAKYEEIVDTPRIHGIQSLELSHFVIRVVAETQPVYQWAGARIIRKEIKERLYKEGIEIPSPRLVMYTRNESPTTLETKGRQKQSGN